MKRMSGKLSGYARCPMRTAMAAVRPRGMLMARGVNKVILVGNLGADPEARSMPSGMTVTNIRIATSESWNQRLTYEPAMANLCTLPPVTSSLPCSLVIL